MWALSTTTWRVYSWWVSLCFDHKELYSDQVLINKFKRCYGSVGLQAVLLSQNDHDSCWFAWEITSVGVNLTMQGIKLIHILQLQPDWERSCESSDINLLLPSFLLSLLYASSIPLKAIGFIEPNPTVSIGMARPELVPLCCWSFISRMILCAYCCVGSTLDYSVLGLILRIWLSNWVKRPSFGVDS